MLPETQEDHDLTRVIVYGFRTWDAASRRFVRSPAKAEVSTIEALGGEPIGAEPEAVQESELTAGRLYVPSDTDQSSNSLVDRHKPDGGRQLSGVT